MEESESSADTGEGKKGGREFFFGVTLATCGKRKRSEEEKSLSRQIIESPKPEALPSRPKKEVPPG